MVSIDNLLFDILEASNIKKQHFHGGAMNGVCCRRLLDEVDVVFGKIIKLVIAKVEGDVEKDNAEIHKLTEVVYTFKSLFECMDVVFSKLRILAPTDDEIEEMTIAIKALESMWHELDLSVTPKMHILITHTIAQVICFGGIANKVEDSKKPGSP